MIVDPGRLVQRFFVLLFLGALIMTLLDPFGYVLHFDVVGRTDSLHNLTLLCLSFLFLFAWRVFKKAPLKIRILLSGLFCLAGYGLYDLLWFLDYFTFTLSSPGSVLFGAIVYALMFLVAPLLGISWVAHRYQLPRIQPWMLALVFLLNVAAVLMLEISGFFSEYMLYWNGLRSVDPHDWIWFIGKALGMLSFPAIFIDFHEVKTKLQNLRRRFLQ